MFLNELCFENKGKQNHARQGCDKLRPAVQALEAQQRIAPATTALFLVYEHDFAHLFATEREFARRTKTGLARQIYG
jgi:hypothetical protein